LHAVPHGEVHQHHQLEHDVEDDEGHVQRPEHDDDIVVGLAPVVDGGKAAAELARAEVALDLVWHCGPACVPRAVAVLFAATVDRQSPWQQAQIKPTVATLTYPGG